MYESVHKAFQPGLLFDLIASHSGEGQAIWRGGFEGWTPLGSCMRTPAMHVWWLLLAALICSLDLHLCFFFFFFP